MDLIRFLSVIRKNSHSVVVLFFLVLSFTACVTGGKTEYADVYVPVGRLDARSISLAILDRRPQVILGKQHPDFLGYLRSSSDEIAYPVTTESGASFTDELARALMMSYNLNGIAVVRIPTFPQMKVNEILQKFKGNGTEKLLLIRCDKLYTDGNDKLFIFYDLKLSVYDQNGKVAQERSFRGTEEIGNPRKYAQDMRMGIRQLFGKVLNDQELITAMNPSRRPDLQDEQAGTVAEKEKIPVTAATVQETGKEPPEQETMFILSPSLKNGSDYISRTDKLLLIGKVAEGQGINTVVINAKVVPVAATGVFTSELHLSNGANPVTLLAIDDKNRITEKKIMIDYYPETLSFQKEIEEQARYYGLIIAIDKYDDPLIPHLDNPIHDAQQLYDILTGEYTFRKEDVLFLKDATRADIINALDDLAGKVGPQDNLLIFYAGHGWWDKSSNVGYWLPSDASRNSKADWFSNSRLVDYLRAVHSKHTLLIADACFTGSIFKTRAAFDGAPRAVEKLYELPSRKAMTSGTLTEVPDHSAFMEYLCKRLKNNTQKFLPSEQLFSSIRIAVINNSDAIPQYGEIRNVGDEGGDFIFVRQDTLTIPSPVTEQDAAGRE